MDALLKQTKLNETQFLFSKENLIHFFLYIFSFISHFFVFFFRIIWVQIKHNFSDFSVRFYHFIWKRFWCILTSRDLYRDPH
jgi:hypothetical protein